MARMRSYPSTDASTPSTAYSETVSINLRLISSGRRPSSNKRQHKSTSGAQDKYKPGLATASSKPGNFFRPSSRNGLLQLAARKDKSVSIAPHGESHVVCKNRKHVVEGKRVTVRGDLSVR